MAAHIIPDRGEERNLQRMRALKQRDTNAIALCGRFLFLLAHLMWIVELLEKLRRILDVVNTKVEIIDVLITGPQPRRFVWRVSAVGRQREIRPGGGDGWLL